MYYMELVKDGQPSVSMVRAFSKAGAGVLVACTELDANVYKPQAKETMVTLPVEYANFKQLLAQGEKTGEIPSFQFTSPPVGGLSR